MNPDERLPRAATFCASVAAATGLRYAKYVQRDLQKRPTKETYERDLQKKPIYINKDSQKRLP